MKKIHILLTTMILLSSCTILDNDLRENVTSPFDNITHSEGNGFTADYQYQQGVILVDETLLPYVSSVVVDTTKTTLYLYDFVPDDLRPRIGQILAAGSSDKIRYGLGHRVTSVERVTGLYALQLEAAAMGDIFSYLNIDAYEQGESQQAEAKTRTVTDEKKTLDCAHEFTLPLEYELKEQHTPVPGLDVKGNIYGTVSGKIGPIFTYNLHRKTEEDREEEYDFNFETSFVVDTKCTFGGEADLEFDLFKALNLAMPPIIVGVPGCIFTITFTPRLGFGANIGGEVSFGLNKSFSLNAGFRQNMPGKEDGPYSDGFQSTPLTWGDGVQFGAGTTLGFHLTVGVYADIGINSPLAGVYFGADVKPGISTTMKMSSSKEAGLIVDPSSEIIKFAVPVNIEGGVFAGFTSGNKLRFDLVKYFMELLGAKVLPYEIPAFTLKFPVYPTFDKYNIRCNNPGVAGETPNFTLTLQSDKYGWATPKNTYVTPYVTIKDRSTDKVVLTRQLSPLNVDKKSSYSEDFSDEAIDRDKIYTGLVEYKTLTSDNQLLTLNSREVNFCATSPSVIMESMDVTKAEWKNLGQVNKNKIAKYTFVTKLNVNGEKDLITKWGIEMNGKKYPVPDDFWKPGQYQVTWTATKVTKSYNTVKAANTASRTLNMKFYIIDNQGQEINPCTETVQLEWQGEFDKELPADDDYESVDMTGKEL